MVNIPVYKRDNSGDYLYILKSLNEIPFPVGKKLLIDFLIGNYKNPSIQKNNLQGLINFGVLKKSNETEILETIQNLLANNMIEYSSSIFNKYIKVLSITQKGKNELIEPTLNKKKISNNYVEGQTEISDKEIQAFKELNDFLEDFNLEQKKAIISSKQKVLCIAGAGTGKTTVLTKRIEFINKLKRVKSNSILAITFTRKARQEMQKRLKSLGVDAVVETFNSFCEKFLLKNSRLVYKRKMRVISFQEKMMAVLRALDLMGTDINQAIEIYFSYNQKRNKTNYQLQKSFVADCFNVLEYFRTTKKDIKKIDETYFGEDTQSIKIILQIVEFLEKYLVTNGLRTYSDQINDTISFLKIHKKFIPEFEHILVDEFQDVNSSQVELLDLLNPKNLFCVGDPRQSIFGWRGSDVNYILKFKQKFPEAEIITLKKNYRSNSHIVDFMNTSIKKMKMTDLESNFENKKQINLSQLETEKEEFYFILKELLNTNLPLEEIFVLARTNRQLFEFSEILKQHQINYILKNEDSPDLEIRKGFLTLSTIHSIKGLEAEKVFIMGCTPNNFPSKSSDHPIIENLKMYEYDKEEEERRLFYVAISRAKNQLHLTYSGKNHTYFITNEMKKLIN
jgi:superfamily I DNA/RNA helicase